MPSQYRMRMFIQDSYYHVFNRGTAKGEIFREAEDYEVFMHFLQTSIEKPTHPSRRKNFYQNIHIIAFALMPNHFHLEIHQSEERILAQFMSSLTVAYSMYFNRKYHRTGALFQGKYQSINVTTDNYLLHLSRYIHLNPKSLHRDPLTYPYSSIAAYMKNIKSWINTHPIDELLGVQNPKERSLKYVEFLCSVDDFHSLEKQDPFL